ncbi:MAG: hybrid sensor histidine kinase/response regulator [Prevotella sp.]|nr:hybrid sensor histidine kinase/response regulator [Prevotella sp.]
MKSNHWITFLIALLILIVIGTIVGTGIVRWREIKVLIKENDDVKYLREVIHEVFMGTMELSIYSESVVNWDENDVELYHEKRMRTDYAICKMMPYYPKNKIDSVRQKLAEKEELLYHISSLVAQKDLGAPSRKPLQRGKGRSAMSNKGIGRNMELLDHYGDSIAGLNAWLTEKVKMMLLMVETKSRIESQQRDDKAEMLSVSLMKMVFFLFLLTIQLLAVFLYWIVRSDRLKRKMMTELQETAERNEQLMVSNRTSMLSVMHELRAPLSAIINSNKQQKLSDKKENRQIEISDQSSLRMKKMIDELLGYYRLENDKSIIKQKPFSLMLMVEHLKEIFIPQARKKHLNFSVRAFDDEILLGDEEKITQIISNLISNAIKFTEEGKVELEIAYKGEQLEIKVSDTGTGISEDEQKRLFTPFERLSNATELSADGFGLGMPIVNKLVKLMGGTLYLDSEKGRGTTFSISIPLKKADEKAIVKESKKECHLDGAYSVLVIDDNDVVLGIMKKILTENNLYCDTCQTVEELLDKMRKLNYDLIITDLKMPEITGVELLKLLRSSSVGNSKQVPVVVSTVLAGNEAEILIKQGFVACIKKPLTSEKDVMDVIIPYLKKAEEEEEKPDVSEVPPELIDVLVGEITEIIGSIRKSAQKMDIKAIDDDIHKLRGYWGMFRVEGTINRLHAILQHSEISQEELSNGVEALARTADTIIKKVTEKRK